MACLRSINMSESVQRYFPGQHGSISNQLGFPWDTDAAVPSADAAEPYLSTYVDIYSNLNGTKGITLQLLANDPLSSTTVNYHGPLIMLSTTIHHHYWYQPFMVSATIDSQHSPWQAINPCSSVDEFRKPCWEVTSLWPLLRRGNHVRKGIFGERYVAWPYLVDEGQGITRTTNFLNLLILQIFLVVMYSGPLKDTTT